MLNTLGILLTYPRLGCTTPKIIILAPTFGVLTSYKAKLETGVHIDIPAIAGRNTKAQQSTAETNFFPYAQKTDLIKNRSLTATYLARGKIGYHSHRLPPCPKRRLECKSYLAVTFECARSHGPGVLAKKLDTT